MTIEQGASVRRRWRRLVVAGVLVALGLAFYGAPALAQVNCSAVTSATTTDTDRDGFSDFVECSGVRTHNSTSVNFPRCVPGADGTIANREACVDPNTKDLFVVWKPAATGSLITGNIALPAGLVYPFGPRVDFPCELADGCGTVGAVRFEGFKALGITVHQLTPNQVGTVSGTNTTNDRRVIPSTVSPTSTQKALRVSESLDTNSEDVLGYCTWGTPMGLDGCTVYTARARNFINSKCAIANDTITDKNRVFLIYTAFLALHEAGHALGGLATSNDPAVGGYHYAVTSGHVMSQAAQFSTQGGRCTWYIPSTWNPSLELPGIRFR